MFCARDTIPPSPPSPLPLSTGGEGSGKAPISGSYSSSSPLAAVRRRRPERHVPTKKGVARGHAFSQSLDSSSSYQFGQGRLVDQVLRPAGRVGQHGRVHVDAEVLVDGGDDLAGVNGPGDGVFAEAVGGADGLASAHA